ncbi:MAG: D-mannonate oxidoreductase, partial [Verrucomicrobia bacterium]|nr:D-mannonate oxidoreductase [Verrucomicrobiota bacterium]
MNETIFKNKTAVVTGAGGTLCSAIAIELSRLGAKVALLGRTV